MLLHGFLYQSLRDCAVQEVGRGPEYSYARIVDPEWMQIYVLFYLSKRGSRVLLLQEVLFFREAFLPHWTVTIHRCPGSSHCSLLEADLLPLKYMQCKKTCSGLWIFFCRFSRVLYTNNQLEECWSHVSVHTRPIRCAAESLTGSLWEKVIHNSTTRSWHWVWGHGQHISNPQIVQKQF